MKELEVRVPDVLITAAGTELHYGTHLLTRPIVGASDSVSVGSRRGRSECSTESTGYDPVPEAEYEIPLAISRRSRTRAEAYARSGDTYVKRDFA